MDDQQVNQKSAGSNDEQEHILPPLQFAPPLMPTADPSAGAMPTGQTVPDERALVPIPDEASDSDLIEKEWVLKAKQIVEHTSTDPFSQQQQLSNMKTEYLKKRYNKDIA